LERPLDIWSNETLRLDPSCVGLKGSPTVVAKIIWTPEVERRREVYKGSDSKEAARWLVERLLAEGVIKSLKEEVCVDGNQSS
jgi:electron transfer flavoprotein beta subunit